MVSECTGCLEFPRPFSRGADWLGQLSAYAYASDRCECAGWRALWLSWVRFCGSHGQWLVSLASLRSCSTGGP